MLRALFTATLVMFALSSANGTQAQEAVDPASNSTLREYRAKLPLLVERYSTNRKIKFRLIRYAVNASPGVRPDDEVVNTVVEVITDGKQMKATPLEAKPAKFKDIVQFWRQDMRFDVSLKSSQYKITDQELGWCPIGVAR